MARCTALARAVALALSWLVALPALATGSQRDPDVISVLSYNVHGLFALAAGDSPGARSPAIGWLANKYDVVLFQEDFEYHKDLAAQMHGKVGFQGNGIGTDARRLLPKALLAPFALVIPHFWPPYGAGISAFVRPELVIAPTDVDRIPYEFCGDWIGGTFDCWSTKGFLRIGLRMPNGAEVDVYTTHVQAGSATSSAHTRWQQFEQLAEAIEQRGRQRGVILGGDLNIAYDRPNDSWVLDDFRRRLGMMDSGAAAQNTNWRERDHLLYRDGTATRMSVECRGEALEFVNDGRALSDHPAIYAYFRIVPATEGRNVDSGAAP